jgi:serine/threonine protein kinase
MATRKESPLLHYKLLEQIGDGSFGSVHKAKTIATNDIVQCVPFSKTYHGNTKYDPLGRDKDNEKKAKRQPS